MEAEGEVVWVRHEERGEPCTQKSYVGEGRRETSWMTKEDLERVCGGRHVKDEHQ